MSKVRVQRQIDQKIKEKGLDLALEQSHWDQRFESFLRESEEMMALSSENHRIFSELDFEQIREVVQSSSQLSDDRRWYLIALTFQLEIEFEKAIEAFEHALEMKSESLYLNECASMYLQLGRFKDAERLFKTLGQQAQENHEPTYEANGWGGLGLVYALQSNFSLAAKAYKQAYAVGKAFWDIHQRGVVLLQIAQAVEKDSQLSEAETLYQKAEALCADMTDPESILTITLACGEYYSNSAKPDIAVRYYEKGLALAKKESRPRYIQRFESGLGMSYEALHHHVKALEHLEQAFLVAKSLSDVEAMGYAVYYLALVNTHLGEVEQARQLFQEAKGLLTPFLESDHPLLIQIEGHITS